MKPTEPKQPRRLNTLILRDASASPDVSFIERCAERWVSDEDKAILASWAYTPA